MFFNILKFGCFSLVTKKQLVCFFTRIFSVFLHAGAHTRSDLFFHIPKGRLAIVYLNFETHLVVYFQISWIFCACFLTRMQIQRRRSMLNSTQLKSNLQTQLELILLSITPQKYGYTYNSKYHKFYLATFHHVTVLISEIFDIIIIIIITL